jgi:hypothetical protein
MKIKQLSEYTIEELQHLLKLKSRQVGTMGSLMIIRELLTRDIKQ